MRVQYSKVYSEHEDLTNPMVAHQVVSAICRREEGRSLFRISEDVGGVYLLLQSLSKPRFDHVPGLHFQTKEVNIGLRRQKYLFTVCCNPVKSGPDNKRTGITDPKERIEWFQNMLGRNGMRVVEARALSNGMRRFERNGCDISAYSVTFKGAIAVEDPKLAEGILAAGIGKCKAFGFGLITLRAYP